MTETITLAFCLAWGGAIVTAAITVLGCKLAARKHRQHELDDIIKRQRAIRGEPCGSAAIHCKNPGHAEYFRLTVQRERLTEINPGLLRRMK